jgi:hypothetical protein
MFPIVVDDKQSCSREEGCTKLQTRSHQITEISFNPAAVPAESPL